MELFLVGVIVLVVVVFRLRVWEVGLEVAVGVEVRPGVFISSFSVIVLRGIAAVDDLSSPFWLFACTGRRRGDLNGLVSVDVAFSRRRRFPDMLTIMTLISSTSSLHGKSQW